MYLAHHQQSGRIFEFDPDTGSVFPAPTVPEQKLVWGFLWKQRGKWFAIRKDEQSLLFQHGEKTWRLDSNVQLCTSKGLRRRFEIRRNDGTLEFGFTYLFRGALLQAIDPTYDAFDEDIDDFFSYVVAMWDGWKNQDIALFHRNEPRV